ncbi:MAG: FlgD immunoglobulin-like domain containing protein [bacterium]|jgi:hypothetical protein
MSRVIAATSILLMWLLVMTVSVQAADPDLDWHELYGDSLRDIGTWVETSSTYGYVACGFEDFEGSENEDAFLMRLDEYGDTMWVKSYGDSLEDHFMSLKETSDGGYILAGFTERVPYNMDAYLVRTDAAGDTLWTSNFDYGRDEILYRVLQTPDGGFIAAGFTSSFGSSTSTDILAMKVDVDGNEKWMDYYMGPGHNRAYDMCEADDGDYVITGFTDVGAQRSDMILLKIAEYDGDSLWAQVYGDTSLEVGRGIRTTPDGGFIVAGYKRDYSYDWSRGQLLRTDEGGDTLWTREYEAGGYMFLHGLEIAADNGFICVGSNDTSSTGDSDFYFLKTDTGGDVQWTKMIGKGERESASCVTIADDLGYVAIGYSRVLPATDYNIYIMKLEGDDAGVAAEEEEAAPGLIALEGASPFTRELTVRYEIPAAAQVALAVYDISGRHVATLAEGRKGAGSYRAVWDLTNARGVRLPSGVYFIRCAAEGRSSTVKALVLR